MAQCRKCDECIAARKRMWIGRLLAEQQTCLETWFCTFTYRGGDENTHAQVLRYSDLQKTFKRLRRAGHKFKYIAVGEYGGKLGRAHFHAIIYWQTPPPHVTMDERIDHPLWPHGFMQAEYPRSQQGAATYIMDYLNKSAKGDAILKYSKNPALGEQYLIGYATKHADEGLALFVDGGATFTIPNNVNQKNDLFFYPVGKQTTLYEKMIEAYLYRWAQIRPFQRFPSSICVDEYLDVLDDLVDYLPDPVKDYLQRFELIFEDIPIRYTVFAITRSISLEIGAQSSRLIVYHEGKTVWQRVLSRPVDATPEETLAAVEAEVASLLPPHHLKRLREELASRASQVLTSRLGASDITTGS